MKGNFPNLEGFFSLWEKTALFSSGAKGLFSGALFFESGTGALSSFNQKEIVIWSGAYVIFSRHFLAMIFFSRPLVRAREVDRFYRFFLLPERKDLLFYKWTQKRSGFFITSNSCRPRGAFSVQIRASVFVFSRGAPFVFAGTVRRFYSLRREKDCQSL